MIDSGQILIIAAITIMTVILTVIGVQLIFILKDVRKILSRTHSIIDQVEKVGGNISSGTAEIVGFVTGIKKLFTVIDHISSSKSSKKKKHGGSKSS